MTTNDVTQDLADALQALLAEFRFRDPGPGDHFMETRVKLFSGVPVHNAFAALARLKIEREGGERSRVTMTPVRYLLRDGATGNVQSEHQSVEAAINNALMVDEASRVEVRGFAGAVVVATIAAKSGAL